jgi:hypothetical protein
MIITPIPHNLELAKSELDRSPGLHMSEIYNDLYQDLEPKRYERGKPFDLLRLEAGLTLEAILEEGVKGRLAERPGEFISPEGVAYSPDLLIWDEETQRTILGEIKLTWMSSREVPRGVSNSFPPKFDKYFTQMKAYCYHLGTPHARLYVFFVNGNYAPPTPELLAWDIEFTPQELQENWSMLSVHAKSKGMLT